MVWKILRGAKKKKVPLSTSEIIRRGLHSHEILEWAREKRLTIFNPPFWGIHHVYIDEQLCHAVICIKENRTAYVFLGNSTGASSWVSYDPLQKPVEENFISEEKLQWSIFDDYVIYRGSLLPATRDPYHWGKVIECQSFKEKITPVWIADQIRELIREFSC